ncbi:MAG: site-2 protease family protein [Cyanobacteria bacterium REEB67]|nr:site-2 protease family protein [Cyanobacteria bacterium REEB67]
MHPLAAFSTAFGSMFAASPLLGIFVMILSLTFLITIHEAGHWIVARLLGFQTPVFSIGFGPRKWSVVLGRFWDTEFRLSPILAGGYVSLPEMQDETTAKELLEQQGVELKELRFFPVWKRIAVALAGVTFNFIGAVLMLFVLFAALGEPSTKVNSTMVKDLSTSVTIARDAGLKPGDTFVSVGGKTVVSPDDLAAALSANKGKSVAVTVKRAVPAASGVSAPTFPAATAASEKVTINMTPDHDGHIGVRLDVNGEQIYTPVPLTRAAYDAGRVTTDVLGQTVQGFGMMLHIVPRPAAIPASAMEVRGIVGIVQMGASAYGQGVFNFVWFLVIISVNLIVMNLLPLPVLDGGHVVFFLIEKVMGKPLDAKIKGRLYSIFFFLLIAVFLLGFTNDLRHILLGK